MTESRIHFEKIDSSGTFRSGDIRLDVKFQDEHGNQYIWFPKWDDLQKLYAEAERVEELNPTGDKDLKELKELKQFDLSVLNAIAEVIADTWQGDDLNRFIRDLGYETEYDQQTEHQAEFNASLFPSVDGAEGVRKDYVMEILENLNNQDYQLIIEVIEQAASPKQHIGKDDRQEKIRYKLNEAIKHEGLHVTTAGAVEPIEYNDQDER